MSELEYNRILSNQFLLVGGIVGGVGVVGVGSVVVVVVVSGGVGGSHIHGCTQVWWKKLNFVPGAHDRPTNLSNPVHIKYRVGSMKSGHIVANCSCVRHSG